VALIYISLMTSDVEHIFLVLLSFHIFSFLWRKIYSKEFSFVLHLLLFKILLFSLFFLITPMETYHCEQSKEPVP
jgi:hypothetical protein